MACVPSPSSRVIDAPAVTEHASAATRITSGGLLLLSVSIPFAAVPAGMPPLSCAPAGAPRGPGRYTIGRGSPQVKKPPAASPPSFVTQPTKGIVPDRATSRHPSFLKPTSSVHHRLADDV